MTAIELISVFGTAERALQSLKNRDEGMEPDVVLLDLNLPGVSGVNALPDLRASFPAAKAIVLTQSDRERSYAVRSRGRRTRSNLRRS